MPTTQLSESPELPHMPPKPPIAILIEQWNALTDKKNNILEQRRRVEDEIKAIMRSEKKSKISRCGKRIRIIGKERLEIKDVVDGK